MKDINLFSNQVNKKKDTLKKKSYKRVFIYIGVFLTVMVIGSWVYMQRDIMDNNKQIAVYENKINNPETIEKLAEYNTLKKELSNVENYSTILGEVDKAVILAETVTSDRMKSIKDVMPKDMAITSIKMDKSSIAINGECGARDSVAEFEHNLIQLEFMESVFVKSIKAEKTGNKCTFDIDCTVKGGVE